MDAGWITGENRRRLVGQAGTLWLTCLNALNSYRRLRRPRYRGEQSPLLGIGQGSGRRKRLPGPAQKRRPPRAGTPAPQCGTGVLARHLRGLKARRNVQTPGEAQAPPLQVFRAPQSQVARHVNGYRSSNRDFLGCRSRDCLTTSLGRLVWLRFGISRAVACSSTSFAVQGF